MDYLRLRTYNLQNRTCKSIGACFSSRQLMATQAIEVRVCRVERDYGFERG